MQQRDKNTQTDDFTIQREGRWDRSVYTLRVALNKKNPGDRLENSSDWNMHLFALRSPIVTSEMLTDVIELDEIRIYPPINISRGRYFASLFSEVSIPELSGEKRFYRNPWTESPTINMGSAGNTCYGFRVDLKEDTTSNWDDLGYILDLIRERSLQWWINSPFDPFDIGARFVVDIGKDGRPTSNGPADNNEPSAWDAEASIKLPLGWESVLDDAAWKGFGKSFANRKKLESATTSFLDAISSYMAKNDIECIYRLCIALEIMESKIRRAKGKPTDAYALGLLKGSILWNREDKIVLQNMFSDRGNIAHGKKPHYYSKENNIIFSYLDLTRKYYEKFLGLSTEIGWEKISEMG